MPYPAEIAALSSPGASSSKCCWESTIKERMSFLVWKYSDSPASMRESYFYNMLSMNLFSGDIWSFLFFFMILSSVCSSTVKDYQHSECESNFSIFMLNYCLKGFILQFHWFLIVLSLRPGMNYDIADHLLPNAFTHKANIQYYRASQAPFDTPSLKWLCHRYLHCFPVRLFKQDAISAHWVAPIYITFAFNSSSSSFVHTLLRNFFNPVLLLFSLVVPWNA